MQWFGGVRAGSFGYVRRGGASWGERWYGSYICGTRGMSRYGKDWPLRSVLARRDESGLNELRCGAVWQI